MTDAGMTGDYDSVIGMQKEEPGQRASSDRHSRREVRDPPTARRRCAGVAVETDDKTGPRITHRAGATSVAACRRPCPSSG